MPREPYTYAPERKGESVIARNLRLGRLKSQKLALAEIHAASVRQARMKVESTEDRLRILVAGSIGSEWLHTVLMRELSEARQRLINLKRKEKHARRKAKSIELSILENSPERDAD